MIADFVNFALANLDEDQRLVTVRILDAVRRERLESARANRPFGQLNIIDIIDREWIRENDKFDRNSRSTGGGKKIYYKRFTRKNRSKRRK